MSEKAIFGALAIAVAIGLMTPDGGYDALDAPRTTLPASSNSNSFATIIPRAEDGHFYADVQVNGQPVRMLIDTGASTVALRRDDAARIGLLLHDGDLSVVGRGASGAVLGKNVMLESVAIDGKHEDAVRATILADGLPVSLLGQSYLARLNTVTIEGDRMTIR